MSLSSISAPTSAPGEVRAVGGINWQFDGTRYETRDGKWALAPDSAPFGCRSGWELRDADGSLVQWTADPDWLALRIAALLIAGWRHAGHADPVTGSCYKRGSEQRLLSDLIREQREAEK
jgi:hypothetical protein